VRRNEPGLLDGHDVRARGFAARKQILGHGGIRFVAAVEHVVDARI
jgi:hypothetical protein